MEQKLIKFELTLAINVNEQEAELLMQARAQAKGDRVISEDEFKEVISAIGFLLRGCSKESIHLFSEGKYL